MRRRILLLVVGMTVVVVLAFAIPLAVLIRSAVVQRASDGLTARANTIGLYLRGDVTTSDIRTYLAGQPGASVQLPDGTVLGTLPPGPASPHPGAGQYGDPHADDGPGGPPQPQLMHLSDGRVAQLGVNGYLVRVYASSATLHSGEGGWWLLLGGGSVVLLLAGVGVGELVTRRIVRPLERTADTAHRMSAGDVTARAPTDGPREVASVGAALNRLGERIDELIAEERETVADLSHRMRTPLTALRLDAESLRDRDEAERIGEHVSALERTLTAVIRAARRPQREGRLPSADASAVVGERAVFWSALADDQGRTQSVSIPSTPLLVRASAEDLAAAVDALLENVIAHTPDGTAFSVALRPEPSGAVLEVGDAGPGLPAGAGERGRSDRGSSGLGLDIARQVAESSGGSISFGRSEAGGALVQLRLGAP